MADKHNDPPGSAPTGLSAAALFDGLLRRATRMAGGTLDKAMDLATMSAMFGDSWLRDFLVNSASPERLQAMADAGHFLRDARETAGLTLTELSDRLNVSDDSMLEGVEKGETLLPLEVMLRAASLLARHDPVPFLLQFLRSYNPQLEATLEQWGVMALPRNYERERRFINLYRQHDFLRALDDEGYQRFIEYMDASTNVVVDVMQREAQAVRVQRPATARNDSSPRAKRASSPARRALAKAKTPAQGTTVASQQGDTRPAQARPPAPAPVKASGRPKVRKVKPRSRDS